MMLRAIVGFVLACLLSLTSVPAAEMRARMAGATEMVICAGTGVAAVTLDATGVPLDRPHHCPVCTAASPALAAAACAAVARPVTAVQRVDLPAPWAGGEGGASAAMARGPPVAV